MANLISKIGTKWSILKLLCLSIEDRASISAIEATYFRAICKTKWQTVYFILFYKTKLSLVENYFLSIGNNDHLFCFHFVYKRLINRMLENFPCSWLNHKIRTARNETPMQLFLIGMQQVAHKNDVVSSQFFESLNVVSV